MQDQWYYFAIKGEACRYQLIGFDNITHPTDRQTWDDERFCSRGAKGQLQNI